MGLRADVAPMIALVLHEVTSNAAKYGALSAPDGIVQVRWSVNEEGLEFSWRELSGPTVEPPTRNGFGRSLIEKAIPYEFDGTTELEYPEEGVKFSFTLPADVLVDLEEETQAIMVGTIGEVQRTASGRSVLMVEDNVILAMDMVDTLTRMGATQIKTASTVEAALIHLNNFHFDFAILDVNLRGVVSFEIAKRLLEMNVPFLFVTGYGSKIEIPAKMKDIPVLTKPVDDGTISSVIAELLADESA